MGKSWKITIEIVDFSIKHRDFPVRYVSHCQMVSDLSHEKKRYISIGLPFKLWFILCAVPSKPVWSVTPYRNLEVQEATSMAKMHINPF